MLIFSKFKNYFAKQIMRIDYGFLIVNYEWGIKCEV